MKFSFASSLSKRDSADLLILPFWEGAVPAADLGPFQKLPLLESGDFKGKNGETALCYLQDEKEPRVLLLGLGKQAKATVEGLRRAYAAAVKVAMSKKAKTVNLLFPTCKQKEDFLRGIADGLLLTSYAFTQLKNTTLKENPVVLVEKVQWIGVEKSELLSKLQTINAGIQFVRDLVNQNADDKTPATIGQIAKSLEKKFPKIKTTVFDKKKIEEEEMGLLLAVNRSSSVDPCFVQTAYRGDPKSSEHIVLVGKGVTYDTGGLSLKPTDGMLSMKCDMAGAATAIGTVMTAAALGLKINVTAVTPLTENCIGSKSYKLGDVYRSYSGKTVEINNTDAEGRLILADALSFAVENLKPSCIIDLATLTGAIVVALGDEMTGLFTDDDDLAHELLEASEKTGELIWRMPLNEDYQDALKSDIADLINSGGRSAGSIKAALFLQQFVGDKVSWAHLDIAGPAYLDKPKHYNPSKGTGYGVRLLIDFLERRISP